MRSTTLELQNTERVDTSNTQNPKTHDLEEAQMKSQCEFLLYIPVSPFVVIPRDELHEVLAQCNSSLCIKYARPTQQSAEQHIRHIQLSTLCPKRRERSLPAVAYEVRGNHIIFSVTQNALEVVLRLLSENKQATLYNTFKKNNKPVYK